MNIDSSSLLFGPEEDIQLSWRPSDVIPGFFSQCTSNISVDISIYRLFPEGSSSSPTNWKLLETVLQDEPNSGSARFTLPFRNRNIICDYPSSFRLNMNICPVAIKVSVSNSMSCELPSSLGIWTGVAFLRSGRITDDGLCVNCEAWSRIDSSSFPQAFGSRLLACPPNQALAIFDSDFERESRLSIMGPTTYDGQYMSLFHEGVSVCYRQTT